MKTKNNNNYEITTCKLTDFKPAEYNPRYMNEDDKNKLKNSLKLRKKYSRFFIDWQNMRLVNFAV